MDATKLEGKIEFEVVEQTPERVVADMPIQPGIMNPYGEVHGGAILWFADVTATILVQGSSHPTEEMAGFPLSITRNANFIGNQKNETLRAVATFVDKGNKLNVVRTIVLGKKDRLIVDMTTNHVPAKSTVQC